MRSFFLSIYVFSVLISSVLWGLAVPSFVGDINYIQLGSDYFLSFRLPEETKEYSLTHHSVKFSMQGSTFNAYQGKSVYLLPELKIDCLKDLAIDKDYARALLRLIIDLNEEEILRRTKVMLLNSLVKFMAYMLDDSDVESIMRPWLQNLTFSSLEEAIIVSDVEWKEREGFNLILLDPFYMGDNVYYGPVVFENKNVHLIKHTSKAAKDSVLRKSGQTYLFTNHAYLFTNHVNNIEINELLNDSERQVVEDFLAINIRETIYLKKIEHQKLPDFSSILGTYWLSPKHVEEFRQYGNQDRICALYHELIADGVEETRVKEWMLRLMAAYYQDPVTMEPVIGEDNVVRKIEPSKGHRMDINEILYLELAMNVLIDARKHLIKEEKDVRRQRAFWGMVNVNLEKIVQGIHLIPLRFHSKLIFHRAQHLWSQLTFLFNCPEIDYWQKVPNNPAWMPLEQEQAAFDFYAQPRRRKDLNILYKWMFDIYEHQHPPKHVMEFLNAHRQTHFYHPKFCKLDGNMTSWLGLKLKKKNIREQRDFLGLMEGADRRYRSYGIQSELWFEHLANNMDNFEELLRNHMLFSPSSPMFATVLADLIYVTFLLEKRPKIANDNIGQTLLKILKDPEQFSQWNIETIHGLLDEIVQKTKGAGFDQENPRTLDDLIGEMGWGKGSMEKPTWQSLFLYFVFQDERQDNLLNVRVRQSFALSDREEPIYIELSHDSYDALKAMIEEWGYGDYELILSDTKHGFPTSLVITENNYLRVFHSRFIDKGQLYLRPKRGSSTQIYKFIFKQA